MKKSRRARAIRKAKKTASKRTITRKKLIRKPAMKTRAAKEKGFNKCLRCNLEFASRGVLKNHLKLHNQALREIKLLEEGHVPVESKIGMEFKGKNRIIIS